jgi:hypothetical protein
MRAWGYILVGSLIAGCASSASEISPQYVSPLQYQGLTCQQLAGKAERISRRVAEVSGVQDAKRTSDAWTTGAAIVIFWPAAFFVKGDGQTAAELERLKGEFEAVERVGIEKNCNLRLQQKTKQASGSIRRFVT